MGVRTPALQIGVSWNQGSNRGNSQCPLNKGESADWLESGRRKSNPRSQLGNLTLTAYNSALGTKSFQERRDRVDEDGEPIGYKNGLKINVDIAELDAWNRSNIQLRTTQLASSALALFPL
jgi:Protein of unknown function (DUF1524)